MSSSCEHELLEDGYTIDAWELVIDAPENKVVGEKFQVSYGSELKVKEILDMCYDICGLKKKDRKILIKDYRPGEKGQREFFSNKKARKVLGYFPKIAPLKGIELTKNWIINDLIKNKS